MKEQFKEKFETFKELWEKLEKVVLHTEGEGDTPFNIPLTYTRFEYIMVLQGKCRILLKELYTIMSQIDDVEFFVVNNTFTIPYIDKAYKMLELGNYGKQR